MYYYAFQHDMTGKQTVTPSFLVGFGTGLGQMYPSQSQSQNPEKLKKKSQSQSRNPKKFSKKSQSQSQKFQKSQINPKFGPENPKKSRPSPENPKKIPILVPKISKIPKTSQTQSHNPNIFEIS